MRFLRSTLLASSALAAAACGDKVTVPPATTATPSVHSVTVAPATASLTVGGTLNMTAAVTADAGATYTVAWTTSDASKVSVNVTSGAITAVAVTPGVAICASAGGAQGCATIVVTAISQVPATISIASITSPGNLNAPIPVPPGQVAGQIDIRLNVTANSVALDSIVVYVDGASTAKQTFTAAQAAALRSIVSDAVNEQALPVAIVISINTADCKVGTNLQAPCNFTNNTVSWLNSSTNGGNNHAITAKSFGHFAGTTTAASSPTGQSVAVAFGNTSGFFAKATLTPSATQIASVVDALGYQWKSGGMGVQAVPLIYYLKTDGVSPETVLSANLTFNNSACDPNGLRLVPMTPPASGSIIWTGTFTNIPTGQTGSAAPSNVGNYEFNPVTCPALLTTGGEQINITAIGSDNNNLFLTATGVFNFNTTSNFTANPDITMRLDNVGPSGVTGTLTPNGRSGNWLNDAVVLNGLNNPLFLGLTASQKTADGVVASGADLGSGRVIGTTTPVVFTARTGLATDASATVDASAAVTSTGALAESATNASYRLRLRGTDPLGNLTSVSIGTFGVDRTAPVLSVIGGTPANARLSAYSGGSYTFSVTDPANPPAAPSGFFNLGALPIGVSQQRRNVAATTFFCPTGPGTGSFLASTATCGNWLLGTFFASNLIVSELNGAAVPPVDAYYTTTATITDQAGNISAPVSRVQLDDITPAALALIPPLTFVPGGPSVFGGAMADNLDIQLLRANLVYVGLAPTLTDQVTGIGWAGFTSAFGASAFWLPDVIVNAYNATPLIPSITVNMTVTNTMTNVQPTTGAAGVNPAALGSALAATFGFVYNQANVFNFSIQPILAPTLPPAAAVSNTGLAGAGPTNWVMTNVAGTTNLSESGAGGLGSSITLTAQAQGITGTFNNPWSAVQFWAYDATPLTEGWHLIATVGATATTDNGVNRFWSFSTTWTPSAASAPTTAACPGGTPYRVIAIGLGGTNLPAAQQGMALATPVSQAVVTVCP